MINQKKVELKTKMAMFEKTEGREAVVLDSYHEDGLIMGTVRNVPYAALTFVLAMVVFVLVGNDWCVMLIETHGLPAVIAFGAIALVLFVLVYSVLAFLVLSLKHKKNRSFLTRYFLNQRRLSRINKE